MNQRQLAEPITCPICQTWAVMPYASRPTTPIPAQEAQSVMAVGFWLASREAKESELCQQHSEMLVRLDVQKHAHEEWQRSELLRIEAEKEAEKNKYPSPQHENIATNLLQRIGQVNAPVTTMRAGAAKPGVITADQNTFPCPDCEKPIRNGEVHACTGKPAVTESGHGSVA